ncbi:DUF1287 domain-containing protein [Aliikangiella coralliicola]|uniref:DUF1287 domain-containing protein n=1 Tax=Aliikangiella coralliicola TaxID=2592383 RepID=A0A545UCM5_9GAMM|nr:DUF1287 domain-containing protein [Aliikangiella coralliicola]
MFWISAVYAAEEAASWNERLVKAAQERTKQNVTYSGRYISIRYPGGDVPENIGVCTDVIIRSYRQLGIDLQQLVHEDMRDHFELYPDNWGLKRPDTNIDHRRVPNLQVFFSRFGEQLPISKNAAAYQPGDMVTWMLHRNLPHIGIVSNRKSSDGQRYLIVHNIGLGPREDDFLFGAKITGHYRFAPQAK